MLTAPTNVETKQSDANIHGTPVFLQLVRSLTPVSSSARHDFEFIIADILDDMAELREEKGSNVDIQLFMAQRSVLSVICLFWGMLKGFFFSLAPVAAVLRRFQK